MLELPWVEIALHPNGQHEFLERETDARIQNWILKDEGGRNLGSAKDEWGDQTDQALVFQVLLEARSKKETPESSSRVEKTWLRGKDLNVIAVLRTALPTACGSASGGRLAATVGLWPALPTPRDFPKVFEHSSEPGSSLSHYRLSAICQPHAG